jgi:rod shape-determining protein MreD
MAEAVRSRRALFIALYLSMAALMLFMRLLPLGSQTALPGPDLFLALTCAWVLRRPDYVPVLAIATAFLVEDFLLGRLPGLWALIVVLGTEFLRARRSVMRDVGFLLEWALVTGVLFAMLLGGRLLTAILMAPQPSLGLSLVQLLATIIAFPVVVAVSHWVFGVRKPATGEVDRLGRPL